MSESTIDKDHEKIREIHSDIVTSIAQLARAQDLLMDIMVGDVRNRDGALSEASITMDVCARRLSSLVCSADSMMENSNWRTNRDEET